MAKKHRKKTTRRRRRSVGAVRGMGGVVTKVLAIGAGGVAAAFVNAGVKKSLPSLPPWSGGVASVGLGAFLPKFVRNPMAQDFAAGMIAAGTMFALNESFFSLPGIAGIGAAPIGFRSTPKLQNSVGAPGFMNNAVGGMRDMMVVGALYDN
jgi:hypothetical protein